MNKTQAMELMLPNNCTSLSLVRNGILQTSDTNHTRCYCLPGFETNIQNVEVVGNICRPRSVKSLENIEINCCYPITPDFLVSGLIVSLVIVTNALIFIWSFMRYRFKKQRRRRIQILPSNIRLPAFACPSKLRSQVKNVITRGLDIGHISNRKISKSIRIFQTKY